MSKDATDLRTAAEAARNALEQTWKVLRAAGTLNLRNGVQLGQTSWYVKISDAEEQSDKALTALTAALAGDGASAPEQEGGDASAGDRIALQASRNATSPGVTSGASASTSGEMTMTPERIAELRGLLAKAETHGGWSVEPHGWAKALYAGRNDMHHGLRLMNLDDGDRYFDANAALIVAAINALPELLDSIKTLEALLREAQPYVNAHAPPSIISRIDAALEDKP